jgi:hypothetical protein
MNNHKSAETTLSIMEEIEAQAEYSRRSSLIEIIKTLIKGSDNEIVKSTYTNALAKVKEGWPC